MCTGPQRETKKTTEIIETLSKQRSHLQQQVHFYSSNRSYNGTKSKVGSRLQNSLVTQLPESLKILSFAISQSICSYQQNQQLVLLHLSMLVSHLWVPGYPSKQCTGEHEVSDPHYSLQVSRPTLPSVQLCEKQHSRPLEHGKLSIFDA